MDLGTLAKRAATNVRRLLEENSFSQSASGQLKAVTPAVQRVILSNCLARRTPSIWIEPPVTQYLDGTPCNTNVLDHTNTVDYGGGFGNLTLSSVQWTTFNGTLDGNVNQEDINMTASCLTWQGYMDDWSPLDVALTGKHKNFAWLCNLHQTSPNTWNFTNYHDLSP